MEVEQLRSLGVPERTCQILALRQAGKTRREAVAELGLKRKQQQRHCEWAERLLQRGIAAVDEVVSEWQDQQAKKAPQVSPKTEREQEPDQWAGLDGCLRNRLQDDDEPIPLAERETARKVLGVATGPEPEVVYVIRAIGGPLDGCYKIGTTTNFYRRLEEHRAAAECRKLDVLTLIRPGGMENERRVQARWREFRVPGTLEWFTPESGIGEYFAVGAKA